MTKLGAPAPGSPGPELRTRRRRGTAGRLLAVYALTAWAVVTVVFFLPRVMPGDPLTGLTEPNAPLRPADRARIEAHYNLDRPLVEQYRIYLGKVVRLDFGRTIGGGAPVRDLIAERLPWTLLLMGTALAASSAIGFAAGMSAAWSRGSRNDRQLLWVMTALHAIPEYIIATLLLLVFVVRLRLFPTGGAITPFNSYGIVGKWRDIAYHLTLPAVALTLGLMGTKFRLVRNTTISVLGQDYMVLARAKGLSQRRMKYHHAARNVMLPFITVLGLQLAFAVGGSLFVETVFSYPGLASLMIPAVENLDFPLMEACFLMVATLILLANLFLDLAYGRIDPRARAE